MNNGYMTPLLSPSHQQIISPTSKQVNSPTSQGIASPVNQPHFPNPKSNSSISNHNSSILTPSSSYSFAPKGPSSISEIFSQVSQYITNKFSVLISITYTFTDIKLLSNENQAFGVTEQGFVVSLSLSSNTSEELFLSKNGLSGILIYNSEKNALAKEKANGKIFVLDIPRLAITRIINVEGEGVNGIGKMGFSPDERYLYARLWKGEVVRWDMSSYDQDLAVAVKNSICLNVSPDSTVVIGTLDKRILLFSKDLEKELEKKLDFKVDAFISFSQTGHLIILAMSEEIKLLNKSNLTVLKVFQLGCQAFECLMTKDNSFIVASLESGEIAFIDTADQGRTLKLQVHSAAVKSLFFVDNEAQVLSFGDDFKSGRTKFPQVSLYKKVKEVSFSKNNLKTHNKSQEFVRETLISQITDPADNFKVFCSCENFSSDVILVGGQCKNILVWDTKNSTKIGNLAGHEDFIYTLECITNEIVASGSADCSIKLWNFRTTTFLYTLSSHHDTVVCLLKIDSSRLVSGSKDKSVKIWLWQERTLLFQINLNSRITSFLSPKFEILLIGMSGKIQCWELKTYTLLFEKTSNSTNPNLKKLETIIEGNSKGYITAGNEEESFCFSDPFLSPEITMMGQDKYSEYPFLVYLQTIIMYRVPLYEAIHDKWMIFPYMVNTLHYYAYFDMPEYLYSAIMNGAGLITNSIGDTPLTIAIAKRHKECIQSIINAAWEKREENPFLLTGVGIDSILTLNSLNLPCLTKLYSLLLVDYDGSNRYCLDETVLPVIKATPEPIVLTESIASWDLDEALAVEVLYKRSITPFYLVNGSQNSIKMLESLCFGDFLKVFNTSTVKTIIIFKWQNAKRVLFAELFLFLCFYVNVLMFMIFGNLFELSISAHVFSSLLTIENILICTQSRRIDAWCLIDYLRFSFFLVYYILSLFSIEFTVITVGLLLLTSFQGIFYFKLWKSTRRLIALLGKVGYDIFSFLIVLIYLLVSLGAVLHVIAVKEDLHSMPSIALLSIHEENFSEFIENLFLVFITFINPLIMLNILLALSSESNSKRKSLTKAIELRELGKCILKVEYLLIPNRSHNTPDFLHLCLESHKKKTDKLKKLTKIITTVSKTQKLNQTEVLTKLSTFDLKLKELEEFLLSLKDLKPKSKRSKP